ncbi:MAG TPA: hypothetical protein VGM59_04530 [Dongiaceae bacterium]|jgi:hypothetical protein
MSVSGIGVSVGAATGLPQNRQQSATAPDSAEQQFLDYMKEPPTQRMEDAWLKSHGLTRQELDAMPADKRAAVLKQMANDLRQQMEKDATNKTGNTARSTSNIENGINILV